MHIISFIKNILVVVDLCTINSILVIYLDGQEESTSKGERDAIVLLV